MQEYPAIPETYLQLWRHPIKPQHPRTNEDVYHWRRELEIAYCENIHRQAEVLRYATGEQQALAPDPDREAYCKQVLTDAQEGNI